MMSYLTLEVSGNKSWGGYLSIDGAASIDLQDDMVYELEPGQHYFVISTKSDGQTKVNNFQRFLYNNTSSSGAIIDAIERQQIMNGMGDRWEVQVYLEEGQSVDLKVLTNGNNIVAAPMYGIRDLEEAEIEYLENVFAEIHAEQERIANTPRRSKKLIVWGSIIGGAFLFGCINMIGQGETSLDMLAVGLGGVAVGLLLFLLGMRKKVRK
jgi:hypothetical protein